MEDDPTERPLTDRELAQVLIARADEIAEGEVSREAVLVELLQLVARETPNVEQRIDTIGTRGRVSFGRDRAGEYGTALFIPDYVTDADELVASIQNGIEDVDEGRTVSGDDLDEQLDDTEGDS